MIRLRMNRAALMGGMGMVAAAAIIVAPVVFADNAEEIPGPSVDDSADYVGYQQCQVCHSHQNQIWNQSGHARALDRLETDESIAIAEAMGLENPPAESPECLNCHATAYDVETRTTVSPIELADGVQCESCHGPSSEHVSIGQQVMFGQVEEDEVDIMAGRGWPGENQCLECHNPDSPTWDEERYELEDGTTTGFDFEQAWELIDHSEPEED